VRSSSAKTAISSTDGPGVFGMLSSHAEDAKTFIIVLLCVNEKGFYHGSSRLIFGQ
jgi:hypothetical protein